MKVVLDSSIFCQDFRLRSTNFKLLFDTLTAIPADLKMPEVVIDEVVNRFYEDLEEALTAKQRAQVNLSRLLASSPSQENVTNAAEEAERYRAWLLVQLEGVGAEILPYPTIPHKNIVQRDLKRRKPFKRNGAGYRDSLIWENVKTLFSWGTEQIVFVTGNTSDFGAGPRVADDLASEVLNPHKLELFSSLKAFNEKHVLPRLELLDSLKARLLVAGASFDFPSWLKHRLPILLRDAELGSFLVGFPEGVGSVWPTDIVALHEVDIDEVLGLSSGEKLIRLSAKLDVEMSVDIDWEDYLGHAEVREWAGETNEPFTSSWSHDVVQISITADLVLDAATEELVSEELTRVYGSSGMVELSG